MSMDRFRKEELMNDNRARCKREHFKSYMGGHRKPSRPDELDAVHVVDLMMGGRYKFVKDLGELFLVVSLP